MIDCPSDEELAVWIEGGAPAAALEAHLAECARCRAAAFPGDEARAEPGMHIGRYRLLERIGAGAMGVVFAAHDPRLDRRVALKLLRPNAGADDGRGRERMLREAQVLARLAHPHVVAIFDAGVVDGHVFVVMELVAGRPLSTWLREAARGWREVLALMTAAGRGLAAAHAGGIVHRDFKPGNVLVGDDGRVAVGDFGLARLVVATAAGEAASGSGAASDTEGHAAEGNVAVHNVAGDTAAGDGEGHAGLWRRAVSRAGVVVGTPAYLAPELAAGAVAGAHSDQYSFCVTLHEALFGCRPGRGPRRGDVPAFVERALARGLAADPAARFPSMAALLDALGRDPARRRWLAAGLAAALALGAGGLALHRRSVTHAATACAGGPARVAAVWNDARKNAFERAVARGGRPAAQVEWLAVAETLDAFFREWLALREEACREAPPPTSPAAGAAPVAAASLDARLDCFDRRLDDTRALLDVAGEVDLVGVQNVVRAIQSLPPLDECRTPGAARPRGSDDLRRRLVRLRALTAAGHSADMRGEARRIAEATAAAQQPSLAAEAWCLDGVFEDSQGAYERARESFLRCSWSAEAARDDRLKMHALVRLAGVVGVDTPAGYDGARPYLESARAASVRLGGDRAAVAEIEIMEAKILRAVERYGEGLGHAERALANAVGRAQSLDALTEKAIALHFLSRVDEAAPLGERVLAEAEALYGREHPDMQFYLETLGFILDEQGHYRRELEVFTRALQLLRDNGRAGSHQVLVSLVGRSMALSGLGRTQEAIAGVAEARRVQARMAPTMAYVDWTTLLVECGYRLDAGQLAAARGLLRQAAVAAGHDQKRLADLELIRGEYEWHHHRPARVLAHARAAIALHVEQLADAYFLVGDSERALGRPRRALEAYRSAVRERERTKNPRHPELWRDLLGMARAQLALGARSEAQATARRAEAIVRATDAGDDRVAELAATLAACGLAPAAAP